MPIDTLIVAGGIFDTTCITCKLLWIGDDCVDDSDRSGGSDSAGCISDRCRLSVVMISVVMIVRRVVVVVGVGGMRGVK
jgi:hypothetical protein